MIQDKVKARVMSEREKEREITPELSQVNILLSSNSE